MFQNMFDRLLALFVAVILIVAVTGGAVSVISTRRSMTDSRMETLTMQAREIAYLAGQIGSGRRSSDRVSLNYLQTKAAEVYEEYDAYILIVDRSGRVMDNMQAVTEGGGQALYTLSEDQLTGALTSVLEGQEVTATMKSSDGPIFTVAVPWTQNGAVRGAVFIHTGTQIIQSEYRHFVLQVGIGFLLAAIVAVAGATIYARGVTRPLTAITHAAEEMSRGKLSTRADVTGVAEVRQLAGSFNVMAERLEKNEESRREFVANVSHELRSPVTSIHGFVEGMLDGTIPQEEAEPYLQIVFDETNRMKRLISDLLQLSRMDKGVEELHRSRFDLNELVRRVLIERMADLEKKKIEVKDDFYRDPCFVWADGDKIAQVVHNIVDNALKYLSESGHLTIITRPAGEKTVSVVIENDGEPIPPEDREHLFDRFYKAEKAHTPGGGTGLGLSICKQIMELHGQELKLTNPAVGAGFLFTLPLAQEEELPRLNPGKA